MRMVLGHDKVRMAFGKALQVDRLHHAWLFYGVQGIGKATLAQQLAALAMCASPDLSNFQACGQCHSCVMLYAGSHPDYAHIELLYDDKKKKYNRDINIAQIREALDFLALSGLKSKRRVLLIDDANFMNQQAANALLKGLEEPAEGSLLLIVCHDLQRLPATIRSRCMLQACSPLNEVDMQAVLDMQGLDKSLHELAVALGQGSPGRVAILSDSKQAKALLIWQDLLHDIGKSDIGEIQKWLNKHVQDISHDLIANVVLNEAHEAMAGQTQWNTSTQVYESLVAVASWPKAVVRHSLRPAPSLMAYILQLRNALKTSV